MYEYLSTSTPVLRNHPTDMWPRLRRWTKAEREKSQKGVIRHKSTHSQQQIELRSPKSIVWQSYLVSVHREEENSIRVAEFILKFWFLLWEPQLGCTCYLGDRSYRQVTGQIAIPSLPPTPMRKLTRDDYDRVQAGGWPTAEQLVTIVDQDTNEARGFSGMIGSIDCMRWEWKNCPTAWHGQYTGHKRKPTLIPEVVASYDTWIWKNFFGMPGACNDINVLDRSTVFHDVLTGVTLDVIYQLNGNEYNRGYYLADGIYPPYANLVKTFKTLRTQAQRLFATKQESVWKDVEHAFGVLQLRFSFVASPAKLWNQEIMGVIMKACIIMHNMIIHDERRHNWPCEYDEAPQVPEITRDPATVFYAY